MSARTVYGWDVLKAGVPGKEWVTAWMDLPKEARADLRRFSFSYGSPYRPLPHRADLGVEDATVVHIRGGTRSLIFTTEPILLEGMYRYELIPVSSKSIGQYILDLATEEGTPVEMTRDGLQAALLFKNPRRVWQLSYFDESGPTGHVEGEEPGKLVYEAYTAGYKTYAPGLVDAMAEHFHVMAS